MEINKLYTWQKRYGEALILAAFVILITAVLVGVHDAFELPGSAIPMLVFVFGGASLTLGVAWALARVHHVWAIAFARLAPYVGIRKSSRRWIRAILAPNVVFWTAAIKTWEIIGVWGYFGWDSQGLNANVLLASVGIAYGLMIATFAVIFAVFLEFLLPAQKRV